MAEADRVNVSDFIFTRGENSTPQTVRCPGGLDVEVVTARKSGRFTARFDAASCEACPLLDRCPTQQLKRKPYYRILRFDQQQVNVAHRRENQRQAQASDQNLRSAVEATVRSVKHSFGNHKLPVRGHIRVSLILVASAAMVNVRRLWSYQVRKNAAETAQLGGTSPLQHTVFLAFRTFSRPFFRLFETQPHYQFAAA